MCFVIVYSKTFAIFAYTNKDNDMDLYALREKQLRELEQNICSDIRTLVKKANRTLVFEYYCSWKKIYIDNYDVVIVVDEFGDMWNIENLSLDKKLRLLHDMYHTR